jgi:nucleoside-diphosphate-sugar epimerase
VHFAVDNSFAPDPEVVVKGSVALTMRALEAAAKEPGLKRFVLTSSYITACQYRMGEVYQVTQDTWNDDFVARAWALPPDAPDRSLCTYGAAKVECERAMWSFVKENKPSFVANAVLPDFVTGASMPHAKPNVGPMSFALEALWSGGESWKFLGPQWMIDAEDTSLLHLGALLHPEYHGERIFGCAHRKNWTDWIARLRKMYPNHQFPGTFLIALDASQNLIEIQTHLKMRERMWKTLWTVLVRKLCYDGPEKMASARWKSL